MPRGVGCGERGALSPDFFLISKWHVLAKSTVLNLKYVIIWVELFTLMSPKPKKYWRDVSPASKAGLTLVLLTEFLCVVCRLSILAPKCLVAEVSGSR